MKRCLRFFQIALFAGATCMLAYCAFVVVDTWIFQKEERHQFARMLADRASAVQPPAAASGVIGLLDIPRLGLSVMVVEGAGTTTLRRAAFPVFVQTEIGASGPSTRYRNQGSLE